LTAVGAAGHNGLIRHGSDGTSVFGRLSVGHRNAIDAVDTRESLRVAVANFENTVLGSVGDVVGAPDTIVNMFAIMGSIGTFRITGFETELIATNKVVPFNHLLVGAVATAPCVGVNKSTQRVAPEICAMRIQFTSIVTVFNVDPALIEVTDKLDIILGLYPLKTCHCAFGYQAGTVSGFGAPCNHFSFSVGNRCITLRRTPNTKVIDGVEEESLAKRLLVFGCRVALVITDLAPTDEIGLGISLVRETAGISKSFGCKWSCWESLLSDDNGEGSSKSH